MHDIQDTLLLVFSCQTTANFEHNVVSSVYHVEELLKYNKPLPHEH